MANLAWTFNGTSDYLQFLTAGTAQPYNLGTGSASIAFWFKPRSLTGIQCIFDDRVNVGSETQYSSGWEIHFDATKLYFSAGATATSTDVEFTHGFVVDRWYHVCLVADRTAKTIKYYRNGILVDTVSITATATWSGGTGPYFGVRFTEAGAVGNIWYAAIDLSSFYIYKLALTALQVSELVVRRQPYVHTSSGIGNASFAVDYDAFVVTEANEHYMNTTIPSGDDVFFLYYDDDTTPPDLVAGPFVYSYAMAFDFEGWD